MVGPYTGAQKQQEEWNKKYKGMYKPDASAFGDPGGTGLGVTSDWLSTGASKFQPQAADYWRSRAEESAGLAGTARGSQADLLGYLNALAQGQLRPGEKSLSQLTQQEALQRIQSQAAAARRTARTPAEARAALYSEGEAGMRAAQLGAQAGLQEQRQAQQAAAQLAGQMRGQDIQQIAAAQQGLMTEGQMEQMRGNMVAKYLQLGLTDREARRRAAIDLEKMKLTAWEGERGRQAAQKLLETQMGPLWERLLMGGLTAGGLGLAAFAASDERVKNINDYVASCAGAKDYGQIDTSFLDDPAIMRTAIESQVADTPQTGVDPYKIAGEMVKEGVKAMKRPDANINQFINAVSSGQDARVKNMLDSIAGDQNIMGLAPSDERVKVFLNEIDPVNFTYKNPEKHGYGERTGVIAQDVERGEERSGLGEGMVVKDEEGVRHLDLDPQKTVPLFLASLANLNDRLNRLEGK